MKYRVIYLVFLPIVYFLFRWTYYSIIILSERILKGIKHTEEQIRSSGICGIFWSIIIILYFMYLDDQYKIVNRSIKFLTKERTFKT